MTDPKEIADVTHFITTDNGRGVTVTACGKDMVYPMAGNGWRVRDISCPDCDRVVCDLAHNHLLNKEEEA